MTMNSVRSIRKQSGVGLIEVLIAVLVLSIGFLGMAALQAKALSNNNSAMARTQAVIASYSIMDAMRADRDNAMDGDYDGSIKTSSCPAATGSQAERQIKVWCEEMARTLGTEVDSGAGTATGGSIQCDNAGACTVTIVFDDQRGTGGSSTQTLTLEAMI